MFRHFVAGIVFLSLGAAAHADEPQKTSWKDPAGIGLGALIGGLVGGPPGAVIGAAGVAFMGDRANRKDGEIADLEHRLAAREEEFGRLEAEFAARRNETGDLQRAALERRRSALDRLASGVSVDVYFRTGSAEPEPEFRARLQQLAAFLKDFPEIRLDIEGHADRRGSDRYNQRLSERRAAAVRAMLTGAGLPAERMRIRAWGERQATAAEGDSEGYPWDRRVSISLSLDREA
jgi:outer membrane protein OmpA-like peptidoglycan-associated protein